MTWGANENRRKASASRAGSRVEHSPADHAQRVADLAGEGDVEGARLALEAIREQSPEEARRAERLMRVGALLREPVAAPDFTDRVLDRVEREDLFEVDSASPARHAWNRRGVRRGVRRGWRVSPTLAAVMLGAAVTIALIVARGGGEAREQRTARVEVEDMLPPAQPSSTINPPRAFRLTLGDTSAYERLSPSEAVLIRMNEAGARLSFQGSASSQRLSVAREESELVSMESPTLTFIAGEPTPLDELLKRRSGLLRLPTTSGVLDATLGSHDPER
jgi:hypothetical protein